MTSEKWRPFCIGLNVLVRCYSSTPGDKTIIQILHIAESWIPLVGLKYAYKAGI